MVFNHNRYLNYELPTDWCSEENEDTLVIYNPNGDGAMVLSFFNVLTDEKTVDEQISILAKRFVDQNRIKLKSPFIIMPPKSNKSVFFRTPVCW